MKRFFAFVALALVVAATVTSCGGSQGGHCDAYGKADSTEETSDLASK